MFNNIKKKAKKAASVLGNIIETAVEGLEDIVDEIEGPDFD